MKASEIGRSKVKERLYMTDTRIYHGELQPSDIARDIIAHFNRGNYRVQQIGRDPKIAVQIATHQFAQSGGQTASRSFS